MASTLQKTSSSQKSTTTQNSSSTSYASGKVDPGTQANKDKYSQEYREGQKVQDAYNRLQETLNNKPGDFSSSYKGQLDAIYNQIMNREKFSYNMNADALYNMYKDQYTSQGKTAMQDTMGQAAALTGGYGSSYAQTAGQQAYQSYLEQLNNIVPELYDRAYQKYSDEGNQMRENYNMTKGLYDTEYGQYRDKVSDYQSDRDYYAGMYQDERDFDYNKYNADRDYWTNEYWNEKNSAQTTDSHSTSTTTTSSSSTTRTETPDGGGSGGSGKNGSQQEVNTDRTAQTLDPKNLNLIERRIYNNGDDPAEAIWDRYQRGNISLGDYLYLCEHYGVEPGK